MLQLTGLTKRYGDVLALDGLSMTVAPGRIHGIVGRNGAGKTTAMRITLGLAKADAGEVLWKGEVVSPADRRRFGYMPEERGLYPKMSALAQVTYFARLSGMPRDAAAAAAASVLDSMGLGERATEPVEQLSLGNQQRAQLAAALVTGPELLVLDEPFSGLDPVGVDVLAGVLQAQVDQGAAVVFSSHQLELGRTPQRRGHDHRPGARGGVGGGRRPPSAPRGRPAPGGGRGCGTQLGGTPRGREGGRRDADEVVLELIPGGDDQAVLDAARRAGRVRLFQREAPSLTDLFREVVAR